MEKENKFHFTPVALILFWLGLEYVSGIHLGSIISEKWVRWTTYTGMAGASLWILVATYFLYLGLFRKWPYALVFVIVIVAPIFYSYTLPSQPAVTENGEWVARTAAWISVLILLSAFIKEFTRKK